MKLLTTRKEKWVAQFKPNVIRGNALILNATLPERYYKDLASIIDKMSAETEKEIKSLFSEEYAEAFFAQDDSISSQARILMNALIKKFDKMFDMSAKTFSERMAKNVNKSSASTLHSSLEKLSGGLSIKTSDITPRIREIMKSTISENVGLIKSIQEQYLKNVSGQVYRSIANGRGMADLVPYLRKQKGITLRRARLIALDQTKKAYSNINAGRMQDLEIDKYEWVHSGGSQKPRKEHIDLNGSICSLKEPPIIDKKTGQRGKPGDLINCNCIMRPIIEF